MQRYFAKEKIEDTLILQDSDHHHISKVMRNTIGDIIEVVYEEQVYICEITSLNPLLLKIVNAFEEDHELPVKLTIAVSLVNEQKMDLILQKLTELGVSKIIPLKTERSIIKLDDGKETKKITRWHSICKEASEQSKRTTIPEVTKIMTLKELANANEEVKLICSLSDGTLPLDEYMNKFVKDIIFVIGPEGGLTPNEEKYLLENNYKPTSLGKRVMRVETAAIYVASIINYVYKG